MFRKRNVMRLIAQSVIELDDSIRDMEARIHGHIGSLEAQINNPPPPFEPGKKAATALTPEQEINRNPDTTLPEFPNEPGPGETAAINREIDKAESERT